MTVAYIHFTDTITLGSTIVLILGVGLAFMFTARSNVVSVWRANYEAEKVRADEAGKRADQERQLKHEAIAEAAALRLTRDLTPLLQTQADMMDRLLALQEEGEARYGLALKEMRNMFAQHEERAQERHEASIAALNAIASRVAGN